MLHRIIKFLEISTLHIPDDAPAYLPFRLDALPLPHSRP
jgi:hypothetical protein